MIQEVLPTEELAEGRNKGSGWLQSCFISYLMLYHFVQTIELKQNWTNAFPGSNIRSIFQGHPVDSSFYQPRSLINHMFV